MTSKKEVQALDFALEIISTDAHGDVTVRCLFCLYQGQDVSHPFPTPSEMADLDLLELSRAGIEPTYCSIIASVERNDLKYSANLQLIALALSLGLDQGYFDADFKCSPHYQLKVWDIDLYSSVNSGV
ncbi:unnamed protein product [Sphagnum tenellum]